MKKGFHVKQIPEKTVDAIESVRRERFTVINGEQYEEVPLLEFLKRGEQMPRHTPMFHSQPTEIDNEAVQRIAKATVKQLMDADRERGKRMSDEWIWKYESEKRARNNPDERPSHNSFLRAGQ
jgi:hypothetical protein